MTATAFVIAVLASAALGVGVWLVMFGAVTATTAGGIDVDADRLRYLRTGIAMVVVGLALFVAGAIVGIGMMA